MFSMINEITVDPSRTSDLALLMRLRYFGRNPVVSFIYFPPWSVLYMFVQPSDVHSWLQICLKKNKKEIKEFAQSLLSCKGRPMTSQHGRGVLHPKRKQTLPSHTLCIVYCLLCWHPHICTHLLFLHNKASKPCHYLLQLIKNNDPHKINEHNENVIGKKLSLM